MNSFNELSRENEFTTDELLDVKRWELPVLSKQQGVSGNRVIQQDLDSVPQLTVKQVETMQEQAYKESAEKGRKEGYNEGYEQGKKQGYAAGYQEGQSAIQKSSAELVKLLQSLDHPFSELDRQVEDELVTLAIAIAKQIIRRELKTDPGQVVAVVREAMHILPASARKVSLHLHPEDAKLIRDALALEEAATDWKIVEEPLLTRGGCRVDTDTSRIDATVEKHLAAVVASVLGGEREEDLDA